MKVAIISYHFSETSFVLAKHLGELNNIKVDYYFITNLGLTEVPGLNFGRKLFGLGIMKFNNEKFQSYLPNNVSIKLISLINGSRKGRYINKFIIRNSSNKIDKLDYDIINLVGQNNLLIDFYKYRYNRRIIHTLHEITPHYKGQSLTNDLLSFLMEKRIPIIVHSNSSYNRLKSLYPTSNKDIIRIPFGEFESYGLINGSNLNLSNKNRYILWFGWIKPYKGLNILYQAVKNLNDKLGNFKIIVAGQGNDPFLDKMKEDSNFIVFNTFLRNADLVTLFSKCEFVVCPYSSGSQSGILATAFYFNKPLICTDIEAFSEFATDDVNSIFVQPDNWLELSDAMLKLINDTEYLDNLKNGINNYKYRFNWKNIAAETMKFYTRNRDNDVIN